MYAALDIGGTKIAGALVGGDATLHDHVQRPTPATADATTLLSAVAAVVGELARHPLWSQVSGLGIGSAGPVDAARGTVSPVNIPGWRDFPLVEGLRELPVLAGLPITLAGDGVAMAAGEHAHGSARGHANALCMVVSTGVGGGLVVDGTPVAGPTGNAGHIGHISVELDGDPCPCGGRGCLEGLASGTSIARWALEHGWRPAGSDRSAAGVAVSAQAGDPVALAAFDRAGRALASAIATTATLLEIDVAVLGGGVSQCGEVLFGPLGRHFLTYAALPFAQGVKIVPAALGAKAGLVGAAVLASRFPPHPAF